LPQNAAGHQQEQKVQNRYADAERNQSAIVQPEADDYGRRDENVTHHPCRVRNVTLRPADQPEIREIRLQHRKEQTVVEADVSINAHELSSQHMRGFVLHEIGPRQQKGHRRRHGVTPTDEERRGILHIMRVRNQKTAATADHQSVGDQQGPGEQPGDVTPLEPGRQRHAGGYHWRDGLPSNRTNKPRRQQGFEELAQSDLVPRGFRGQAILDLRQRQTPAEHGDHLHAQVVDGQV
jgi:hypothetical protein